MKPTNRHVGLQADGNYLEQSRRVPFFIATFRRGLSNLRNVCLATRKTGGAGGRYPSSFFCLTALFGVRRARLRLRRAQLSCGSRCSHPRVWLRLRLDMDLLVVGMPAFGRDGAGCSSLFAEVGLVNLLQRRNDATGHLRNMTNADGQIGRAFLEHVNASELRSNCCAAHEFWIEVRFLGWTDPSWHDSLTGSYDPRRTTLILTWPVPEYY